MTLPVRRPSSAARRRRSRRSTRLSHGAPSRGRRPGQEHPGERDVLELAQVAEVVVDRQALLARPAQGLAQPPLRDPHARRHRGDGPHIREVVARVQRSASSSSSSAPSRSPSASRTRAIATRQRYGFCGRPACSPSSLLVSRCCVGGIEIVPLAATARSCPTCMSAVPPQHGRALLASRAAIPARRCASPRGDDPARSGCRRGRWRSRSRRRGARPCSQARHAVGIRPVRGLEIPARPGGESQEPRCRAAPEVVILGDEVERPPGVAHGAGHDRPRPGPARPGRWRSRRQAPELLVVHDDHLRWRGRSVALGPRPSCPATARRPAGAPRRPRARR